MRRVVPGGMVVCSALASLAALALLSAAGTGSAASSVNHELGLNNFMLGPTRAAAREPDALVYEEIKTLRFAFGVDLLSEHSTLETTETVRVTLPAGLSFGPSPAWPRTLFPNGTPGPWSFEPTSQSCEVGSQVATCRAEGVTSGTTLFGWIFDVVAAKNGLYKIEFEVVPPTDGTNRSPRGASTPTRAVMTVVIGPRTGAIKASGVVLSRPRPSYVKAVVTVTQGGESVVPSSPACTGSFRGVRSYQKRPGKPLVRRGEVACYYVFNNATMNGKTLLAEHRFSVGKTTIVRKFSVRVGPGTTLAAPKGATLGPGQRNATAEARPSR